jgi:hypothetical protein
LLLLTAALLFVNGCAAEFKKPQRICPSKATAADAANELNSHVADAVPFKANGQCQLRYWAEGREHYESFLVKLWVNPPREIYLQGDVGFNAKGLVLGCNADEFWLAIKPKEISTFIWGKWSQTETSAQLIDPRLLLKAFGLSEIDIQTDWLLSNESGFDVLTKWQQDGRRVKIRIDACDYLVSTVEYFGNDDRMIVDVVMDKYKQVGEGFYVPTMIKLGAGNNDGTRNTLQVILAAPTPASLTENQRRLLFTRPESEGFEHIYEIIDGEMIKRH